MNKPNLIDLNNELEILTYYKNSINLNIYLGILTVFIILLIVVFSKNYSKRKAKKNTLSKLIYIKKKSDNYISSLSLN